MTGSRGVALLLLLATAAQAQGESGSLEARLGRTTIYQGESVAYHVTLRGPETSAEPDLGAFSDFAVTGGGTSSQTQFVNGRFSRQTVYRYSLRPKKVGTLTVPAATLRVGGKTLATRPLTLEVVAPQRQDHVVLVQDARPASVYPLQEFVVRLRIFVRKLPGDWAGNDPIEPLPPVHLQVPWVDMPEGLEGIDFQKWLQPYLGNRRRGGFRINELSTGGGSLFFDDRELATFDLGGRPATGEDVTDVEQLRGKAEDYYVYLLERRFVARRSAELDFGAAVLKGRFAEKIEDRRFTPREIFTASNPLVVKVRAVPDEGKPEAFTGGVGEFSVEATVAPERVRVGDPMTLTVTVRGNGNLEDVGPPPLTGFEPDFRVYEATAENRDGARVFTYAIRPARAGLTEVPPIALAYFDLGDERYETVQSAALEIEVEDASRLDSSEIDAALAPNRPDLEARTEGLFANISDAREVRDESIDPGRPLAYLAALAILYVGLSLGIARRRRLRGDPALVRRRGAASRARARIGSEGALEVFGGLMADIEGLPEAGLTGSEIVALLRGRGVPDALAEAVRRHFEAAEGRRYGATAVEEGESAEALLERVIDALRKGGSLR